MKNLKESLLDDEDILLDKTGDKVLIEKFLKDNYNVSGRLSIRKNKGKWLVSGHWFEVKNEVKKTLASLTNDMFEFYKADYFSCEACENLTSLKGGPQIIESSFVCTECENLKSLEGCPRKIGSELHISGSTNIKNFKYFPETVLNLYMCDCGKIKISDIKNILPNVRHLINLTPSINIDKDKIIKEFPDKKTQGKINIIKYDFF